MKKIFTLLTFIPAALFAQNGFVIKGNVAGLPDGQVKIVTTQEDHALIAADSSHKGAFTIKGTIPEPGLYFIVLGKEQPQYIFLENNPITINGSKAEIKKIRIEGSASHNDFLQFNTTFNPLIAELNSFAAAAQKEPNQQKREKLARQFDSVAAIVNTEVDKFVRSRPASFVSPFVLGVTAQLIENPSLMEQRFALLDEKIKASAMGKNLAEFIAYSKVGAVGTDAMDFTQNDVNGNPVSLSSFRGKYVLVDFWASWCRPCRAENPNVVKAYNKFKDKNFTVLGVSLDQEKNAWVDAIQKDGLSWNHVSDLKYWNNAVAQMYRIQSIPGNMLVDPNGKIIAKDLHGEGLQKKLCEVLGCNEP